MRGSWPIGWGRGGCAGPTRSGCPNRQREASHRGGPRAPLHVDRHRRAAGGLSGGGTGGVRCWPGHRCRPGRGPGTSAYQLLTGPWRRTCLPSRFTPSTAYGPHTQSALALLREARTLAPAVVTRIRRRRAALESVEWATARRDVEDSALPGVIPSGRSACSGKLSRPPRMLRASHPPIPTWLRACGAPRPRRPSPGAWDPIPASC